MSRLRMARYRQNNGHNGGDMYRREWNATVATCLLSPGYPDRSPFDGNHLFLCEYNLFTNTDEYCHIFPWVSSISLDDHPAIYNYICYPGGKPLDMIESIDDIPEGGEKTGLWEWYNGKWDDVVSSPDTFTICINRIGVDLVSAGFIRNPGKFVTKFKDRVIPILFAGIK